MKRGIELNGRTLSTSDDAPFQSDSKSVIGGDTRKHYACASIQQIIFSIALPR